MKDLNLSEEYIKFSENAPDGATFDDFFDHCKIPKSARSDFAVAAILKGSLKIMIDKDKDKTSIATRNMSTEQRLGLQNGDLNALLG